ncbi:low-density lipoprotein receptor-related protein 1B-like isoform X1 [Mytilus californianus]|uniref:low-density lipoprotein receptor-related protein 1B-like isoform X1 n=1 Tax=Mytilus californianus TaxID=6549 RepID=UPI002247BE8F|nr:low-density lipoprotein receptor-related protein 1B-like isoform X1 [Mytilus californianus]
MITYGQVQFKMHVIIFQGCIQLIFICFALVGIIRYVTCSDFLIVSSERGLQEFSLPNFISRRDLYSNTQTFAVSSLFSKGFIFWVEESVKDYKIKRASYLPGTLVNQTVIVDHISSIGDIEVDWIHENLYWLDPGRSKIQVCRLNGSHIKTVYKDKALHMSDLALDPYERWMYLADSSEVPKIIRIGMDGSKQQVLVKTGISAPSAITIDKKQHRIYWVDDKLHDIKSSKFDGSDVTVVITLKTDRNSSFELAIFGSHVIWANYKSGSLKMINKTENKHQSNPYQLGTTNKPYGLEVFGPTGRGCNYCGINNGGCRYLCLPSPRLTLHSRSNKCVCPDLNGQQCIAREVQGRTEDMTNCQQIRNSATGNCQYPKCTLNGAFEALQCDTIDGVKTCWCSDLLGNIIPGTKMVDLNIPDCYKGKKLKNCLFSSVLLKREFRTQHEPMCTATGDFEEMQCNQQDCWCVDTNGKEHKGFRVARPETPSCKENYKVHLTAVSITLFLCVLFAILAFCIQRRQRKNPNTSSIRDQAQIYPEIQTHHYDEITDLDDSQSLADVSHSLDDVAYETPRFANKKALRRTNSDEDDFGYLKPHTYCNSIVTVVKKFNQNKDTSELKRNKYGYTAPVKIH